MAGMKKPERYTVKRAMALKPSEWRALQWYGRRFGTHGLAALRRLSLEAIVYVWKSRPKGIPS